MVEVERDDREAGGEGHYAYRHSVVQTLAWTRRREKIHNDLYHIWKVDKRYNYTVLPHWPLALKRPQFIETISFNRIGVR